LKRQSSFWRRLDYAVQSGRLSFLHWEEAQVLSGRLEEKQGPNPLRNEVEMLAQAYETWMETARFWDPVSVLRQAISVLSQATGSGAEADAASRLLRELPNEIYYFSTQEPESLEREFFESLARVKTVHFGRALEHACWAKGESGDSRVPVPGKWEGKWERWHTLDDAADSLAEALADVARGGASLDEHVILIGDHPAARRSLKRALDRQGVALADPRDPTRTRWDEGLKWALLPLQLVGLRFERETVISWIRSSCSSSAATATNNQNSKDALLRKSWIKEIQERGIRLGLESYSGGGLGFLHERLTKLQEKLGGKKSARELAIAHLSELRYRIESNPEQFSEQSGLAAFFEKLWKDLITDLERVGSGERRAAPLYWLERLQSRLSEAPAPVERLKPEGGVDIFRFHQAPVKTYRKVWFFGLPSNWLSGETPGDYWFSGRDRDVLAAEFAVRSGQVLRQERVQSLQAWTMEAEEAHVLDALYEPGGKERETIAQIIRQIEAFGRFKFPEEAEEKGSHSRWLRSYGALRPTPPQSAHLRLRGNPVLSATLLDSYSRCSFQALAYHRWKLRDLREPDSELWPDIRGNILHEAVRVLVQSRDSEGNFTKTPDEALELAWAAKRPRGLLKGARIESYVKYRLKQVLIAFCEKERDYVKRAGTRVLALENVNFELPFEGFTVVGEPDRIDEHPDGLFIMDYKTSSTAPNGTEMLENGYRLQLPFYSIAARKRFGKEVLGFQFVQLDKKGTRSAGVFFKSHNGKDPGKLTATTGNSKSLLSLPRDDVWARFEGYIQELGSRYIAGSFQAMPRLSPRKKECDVCRVSDFCGFRRLAAEGAASGEEEASS
jgi:hypothetical protein